MSQSLDEFVAEIHNDVVRFKVAYEAKVKKEAGVYPLVLTDDNVGLWFEFFTIFRESGEA